MYACLHTYFCTAAIAMLQAYLIDVRRLTEAGTLGYLATAAVLVARHARYR